MSASASNARVERQIREDTAAFLASYRARGGFEGALARKERRATACTDHMPFPGHKHCGEWS
jgi:hypothetical protein